MCFAIAKPSTMGEVTALSVGLHASIRQIAEETGFDRDTVAKKISEHSVVPSGKRGGHPVFRLKDVLSALYVTGPDGRQDPNKMDPFRRKAHYQAESAALALETERRELIPRIEVEQEQARILRVVAETLDTLPDIIERDCGASAAFVEKMEQVIDTCRESLYVELSADEAKPSEEAANVRDGS